MFNFVLWLSDTPKIKLKKWTGNHLLSLNVSHTNVSSTSVPLCNCKTGNTPFVRGRKEEICTVQEPVHIVTPTQDPAWEKAAATDSVWANSFSHCLNAVGGWSPQAGATSACVPSVLFVLLSCCSQGVQTFSKCAKHVLYIYSPSVSPWLCRILQYIN